MDTILPDKLSYSDIDDKRAFWYYFFAINYGDAVWQEVEASDRIQAWIAEFTTIRARGHFSYINTVFVHQEMWLRCYPDQMIYQDRNLPADRLQEKRVWDWNTFLQQTERWTTVEQLLCIPIVVIRQPEEQEFTAWMEAAFEEILQEDCTEADRRDLQDMYQRILPFVREKQSITLGELQEEQGGKRFRVWAVLFFILILHFFLFPRLVPSQDMIGREGLKRVIVQEIATLPAMLCLTGTICVEGILWYLRYRQKITDIRKGMIVIWMVLLCINGWLCVTESIRLANAVQDWQIVRDANIPAGQELEEEEGIGRMTLKNWSVQESSSMGVTRGYTLKATDRTGSFPLGKNKQRRQLLESYKDQELTIFYYDKSKVMICIYVGGQRLFGDP